MSKTVKTLATLVLMITGLKLQAHFTNNQSATTQSIRKPVAIMMEMHKPRSRADSKPTRGRRNYYNDAMMHRIDNNLIELALIHTEPLTREIFSGTEASAFSCVYSSDGTQWQR